MWIVDNTSESHNIWGLGWTKHGDIDSKNKNHHFCIEIIKDRKFLPNGVPYRESSPTARWVGLKYAYVIFYVCIIRFDVHVTLDLLLRKYRILYVLEMLPGVEDNTSQTIKQSFPNTQWYFLGFLGSHVWIIRDVWHRQDESVKIREKTQENLSSDKCFPQVWAKI